MAITSSAKKAHRASLRKQVFNMRRKKAIGEALKKIRKLIAGKKINEAQKLLPLAYKAYDKAAKENTLKRGTANRRKSRLARALINAA